ncbi:MAG: DUF4492 domain-containing protein [Bacteroidota bacterium]
MISKIYFFYWDGFRSMTIGRKLWVIIFIKLFVMFVILKLFFFKDFLSTQSTTEKGKSEYVINQLTKKN